MPQDLRWEEADAVGMMTKMQRCTDWQQKQDGGPTMAEVYEEAARKHFQEEMDDMRRQYPDGWDDCAVGSNDGDESEAWLLGHTGH